MEMQKNYNIKEKNKFVEKNYVLPENMKKFTFWKDINIDKKHLDNIIQDCLLCSECRGGCGDC